MDHFKYRNDELWCEDVPAASIAASAGTPVYIYSAATLRHHYRAIARAFEPAGATVCFSIKSLSNVHILRLLAGEGSGFDVVSGGELARAQAIGADPAKIVFAGVGKTDEELTQALRSGIGLFNVESEQEFENISALAGRLGVKTSAALRVNPDVYDPRTHTYTATGKKETKFGVDIERAVRFFQTFGRDPNIRLAAIHIHIGSPIYSPGPYVAAITKTLELVDRLAGMGFKVDTLDIGGGFAADYEEGKSPLAFSYAEKILPLLAGRALKIVLEPGRQIACNAGLLLAKVLYVKQGGDRRFVIVDAAMTDLVRPAMYGSEHFIYPARLPAGQPPPPRHIKFCPPGAQKVDVVGGVCESSDFLGKDRMLPPVASGDLMAVFSAGAYGFTMSSQYNSRPRAAEVLVDGDKWRIIRRRETFQDLLAPELDV
ncbi:MAG: diaminopimelate decarboxylase [Planctomycetes bacterium]|nr:diaminopimelate decarboxylase [Planctomycetota bacterium]